MATPRADSYSAASGGGIYAGTSSPPAWLQGKPLNTWFAIPSTSGAGGALVDDYSGLALAGTKWVSAAAGGHAAASYDNRVVAIDFSADAPAWSVLHAPSSSGLVDNAAYYSDGRPAGRHTYSSIFAISGNRIALTGCRYPKGQGDFAVVDVFNMTTGLWDGVVSDAPGTSGSGHPSITPFHSYPSAQDANGDLWAVRHTDGAVVKYTVATDSWSTPTMGSQASPNVRYPWALDTRRGQMFGLAWADGEGFGSGVRAVVNNGTTQTAISFNASTALTQFQTDAPQYAGMDYDQANDRFLFYSTGQTNRVFVITPNNGTTWDMSILSASGSLPASTKALVKKLAYIPAFKVFVCLTAAANNIYALRVA